MSWLPTPSLAERPSTGPPSSTPKPGALVSPRWLLARGFDDLLQRDFKIYNSPRALLAFVGASIGFVNGKHRSPVLGWTNRLLPVGQFGITRLSQTPFYHKFGRFPTLLVITVPYIGKRD